MGKQAFVTGGTGFLGRHLVEQLVAAGWSVTCLHRKSSDIRVLQALGVTLKVGQLYEKDSLIAAMPEGVDAVFHVAANTNMWSKHNAEQRRDNVEGTRAVIEACLARSAKRLVQTSTAAVYGTSLGNNLKLTESSWRGGKVSKVNYERTKYEAEELVMASTQSGLHAISIEPPHIMGRYDTVNWAKLISLAHRGKLPGVPPGSGDWTAASEVARAHITAAERAPSGSRYLLRGAEGTYFDVVKIVCELSKRPMDVRVLPGILVRLVGTVGAIGALFTGKEPDITPEAARLTSSKTKIISTKAEDELGYQLRPLREMVEESYRWLDSQGLLEAK